MPKSRDGVTGLSSLSPKLAVLVFAVTALVLQAAAQQNALPQQTEDSLIRQALAEYQAGRIEPAVGLLRDALKLAPTNPYARLYLGLFIYQTNPSSLEAQDLMASVQEKFPTNPDLILRLADSYLSSGKGMQVPALLDRSRKTMETSPRLALNIVYLFVRYAQIEEAREELDRLAERVQAALAAEKVQGRENPEATRAWGEVLFLRGLIAATLGQKEEAMQQLQAADRHEFPPQDSPQMKMLAEALSRLEEYPLSARAYRVYLSHFPQDYEARFRLGIVYLSSASFERAEEQLREVCEKLPAMPEVSYYLGLVLVEMKRLGEARDCFERELKFNPASYQAITQMAYLEYAQGDLDKCRAWLDKAAVFNPDWPEMQYVYGLLYNRLREYDKAVKSLERVVQENPTHIKAHFQLSIAYRRSGSEDKAKEHADIYNRLLEAHRAKTLGDDPRRK